MRLSPMRCLLPVATLAACIGLAGADKPKAEKPKAEAPAATGTPLFNGKDFTGWKLVLADAKADAAKTFSVKDGVIIVTGKPNGYFRTEKKFKNFVLSFDWQYLRPEGLADDETFGGNSGCLVYMQPPDKVWAKCVEVQGMNKTHGSFIFISSKKIGEAKFDADALKKARHKVGEWNTTEITADKGAITVKVNGTPISSGKSDLKEGTIGFQSEGAEIHFRNINIQEK